MTNETRRAVVIPERAEKNLADFLSGWFWGYTEGPRPRDEFREMANDLAKSLMDDVVAEWPSASDQTPATDPACDPVGTVRDLGNRTSFPEDNPLAHINRYWIKWAPPHDLDEDRPWVAINHEADLQRMPNDLMAAYPVVPLVELAARLRHPAPSSVQGDTTPEEA